MKLQQFLSILRARWLTALLVFALVVASVVAASLLLPKQYTATTQVVIDLKPDPIAGIMLPGMLTPGYVATQVDIVNSQRLAMMVVDKLRIAESPLAIEQFQEALEGKGSIRQYFADLLRKKLDVKPSRESTVLNITFKGADPEFAAAVANAFADAYIQTNIEMKVEPAKQQQTFFDEQTTSLRKRLDDAQAKLSAYQRTNKIVSADERLDVETAKLAELSTQLTVLSSQAVDAQKRTQLAKALSDSGNLSELPEVLQNPLIQNLKANQAVLENRLKEQGSNLGPQHPDIVKMNEELANTRNRIRQEFQTVASSLARAYTIASQREVETRAALERQRAAVLAIKGDRDELNGLQRDVDNAQRAYEGISQRLTQSNLESKSSQANLFVLNRALPPNEHSFPKLPLNTAVAAFLGVFMALGSVLLLELTSRRVRSSEDLAQAIAAPVIGRVSKVARKNMKDPKERRIPLRRMPAGAAGMATDPQPAG